MTVVRSCSGGGCQRLHCQNCGGNEGDGVGRGRTWGCHCGEMSGYESDSIAGGPRRLQVLC